MNENLIKSLPKAELHCHLDGSVPVKTLQELAVKAKINQQQFAKIQAPEKCHDLAEYLESFDVILKMLQTTESIEIATLATIQAAAQENVRYLELRFAPLLHLEQGLSVIEVINAVCSGITLAQKENNIHVNLLICAMRNHSDALNLSLLAELKTLHEKRVVGFDFAGDEAKVDNQKIAPIVQKALQNGLEVTLHSGECGCSHNVIEAIHLGAKRIGHGVAIKDNPKAMSICQQNNILLELCPTSNIQTDAIEDWQHYPLQFFLANHINCCINTDNRTVSNTNLTQEFLKLAQYCQLTIKQMLEVTSNAVQYSFASDELKKILIKEIEQIYRPYLENTN
ncbi:MULTISPECIES: adenosine deaminase [unclassified Enterococcus]|uniref:adenosine deaminase n=1 Tax=unclassified Enterococcus TaxID=2608891 RepID=UPI00155259F1|nr:MULTISPECIES: adenosine deaminase [unclassified Enterococcus]MBS7575975.1 adenosine deaminase [Enterococcus sp. MMGLQ5-2]MBS7583208.1 adenosine deaminase [Enterococcus sp. MMGLQ5-1]NPD11068.1 adenosine deaminase [Enterococcus sp. MMGLQ5-1]NPD35811.1 adenosine deaminase [Enterococcus sp. MMGLQ5-2]